MKTFEETLDDLLSEKLNEAELPGDFEGMYFQRGKDIYQVKKVGNRFFFYSRLQARWMPIKKDSVEYTELSWEDLVNQKAK